MDSAEQIIATTVERVWCYVREHQNSLDAERAHKIIHRLVDGAVGRVKVRLDAEHAELLAARQKLAQCRKELKTLRREWARLVREAAEQQQAIAGSTVDLTNAT